MARRRRDSEHDDQQLYGLETRLIDTHGPRNPGPDPSKFPTPADDHPTGTEPARPGAEAPDRPDKGRRRARPR
jgi:hypothetical protein